MHDVSDAYAEYQDRLEERAELDTQGEVLDSLITKFSRLNTGDTLMFCISTILGTDWVTSPRAAGGLSITSDGFVVSGGLFVGSADDLVRNLVNVCDLLELTEDERDLLYELYRSRVTDWRMTRPLDIFQGNSPYTRGE